MNRVDQETSKRDAAIQVALDHADAIHGNWTEQAFAYLQAFVVYSGDSEFSCADIRVWAEEQGCPEPPSRRAWGGIVLRAKNGGVIRRTGYGYVTYPDRDHSNMTPAALWKKAA